MKRKNFLFIIALEITIFSACQKDNSLLTKSINGYVQKGPFINGSSITVYDLQSDLTASGKTYNTQITDDKGTFELSNILLSSNYVSLRADGFYYNENRGWQSVAQLTLYALSDITDKTNINVNVLTHLEKARVEYLMKSGKTFSESKSQAEKEILAIFNIKKSDVKNFEVLNISESGEDNAILLAISCLLQGYRTESELTELMSNISNDIKEDGTLDNSSLGSALINQGVYLDTAVIRNNLLQRYSETGTTANVPDFGKYIANFISTTSFPVTGSIILYPEQGTYGDNILNLTKTEYLLGNDNNQFSLAANFTDYGLLKIKISSLDFPNSTNSWYYDVGSNINWTITTFDDNTYSQTFTIFQTGTSGDLKMIFDPGSYSVEYYEMGSIFPTRRKTITVN